MKVFISWSGELSHSVAVCLRDWLPSVIQSLEPYVSSEDIDKGARWSTDIAKELEDSSYGVLCITKENVEAPWLNFEAGALSKSIDKSRVSPFLFGVKRSEIKGPILQFQSTIVEREDVKKLLASINNANEEHVLEEARLNQVFEVWWPQLEKSLKDIEQPDLAAAIAEPVAEVTSDGAEILEEVLELIRQQHRLLHSPGALLPEDYFNHILSNRQESELSHPVYRDLVDVWFDAQSIVEAFGDVPTIPSSVVREILERLERPMSFISRRHPRSPVETYAPVCRS